ncbi:isoprenylcysteine carboxylmethyltransferase family protein [Geothrix sp. PMB-07]|uniref:methyltransferase family protein n=1 Tax=Geothrix sp. PMB-07 TaxID=3068640 RepID=UPI0027420CF3|nr:isoprenylcysteine carboxylmethyltransferase family protein [Geothrix sp. PMB-07]WLT32781.1 isoprenylcysteine carboxylmethyltransferase family protein [Geothrix sp. PMB-07]
MNPTGKTLPPPLLFLGCLLAGWGLGFLKALPTHLGEGLRLSLWLLLWMAAAGQAGWAILTFRRHHTTLKPHGVASALLTSGPFQFTRNPLYVSLVSLLAGFGLLLDSAWLLMLVPVLAGLLDRLVIAREEVRLRTQFGEAYLAYCHRVRRWC